MQRIGLIIYFEARSRDRDVVFTQQDFFRIRGLLGYLHALIVEAITPHGDRHELK